MLSTPGFLAPEGSEHLAGSRAASAVSWDGDASCCCRVLQSSDWAQKSCLSGCGKLAMKNVLAEQCSEWDALQSLSQDRSRSFNQKRTLPCLLILTLTNGWHFFISLCNLRCIYPGLQPSRLHVDDYLI